jgi:hypothetical protein
VIAKKSKAKEAVVEELVPIGFGILLGSTLGFVRFSMRLPLGGVLAVVLGMGATAVTGEATISWAFVLIDIPMVALGSPRGGSARCRMELRRASREALRRRAPAARR